MIYKTLCATYSFAIWGIELVNTSVAKKASQAVRLLMMVLTAVLIFFFINVMLLVSDIQGTARVVNYAGLVRGTTQRIVKLEDAGQPQDDLLKAVDSYINGLRYGSDDLNLVRLDDDEYQAKMTELANYYDELCAEIVRVREVGYENTDIIAMSEEFFGICDLCGRTCSRGANCRAQSRTAEQSLSRRSHGTAQQEQVRGDLGAGAARLRGGARCGVRLRP